MKRIRCIAGSCAGVVLAVLANCTAGGGADVGNPLYGTVVNHSSKDTRTSGAMVVLARRGADPGIAEPTPCSLGGSIGICAEPIFFDTVYSDFNGRFEFSTVLPGSYAITASSNGLLALQYVEQRAFEDGEATLYLDEPTRLRVKPYDPVDTAGLHFRGVRVAGTGFMARADVNGVMVLSGVPAAVLDLIFYRSDNETVTYPSFETSPGCDAELDIDPLLPWTPRPCGNRDPRGRPYIIQTSIPVLEGDSIGVYRDGRRYDLRISFSHCMDALSFEKTLHAYSDDSSATIGAWWWDGGNVLYVSLCIADSAGACRGAENRFVKGRKYGVSIDTAASTSVGVRFAHEAVVRFVPVP